jgi:hypothetical protein
VPPRKRLAAVQATEPEPQQPRPPDLRDAVRSALDAMDWHAASDGALRALAERHAEEIERAVDRAEEYEALLRAAGGDLDLYKRIQRLEAMCDVTKTVGWLGVQLQGFLRDLGGTPAARKAMRQDAPIGGRLAALRDAAREHDAPAVD